MLNELNIPNIKISNTDLEVLEKTTLFFPDALFKKANKNEQNSINNINNINNNTNLNNISHKPKLYAIKPIINRNFSYAMKFT